MNTLTGVRRLWLGTLVAVALGGAGAQAWAQRVVRGPYLQTATETGIVVRWRTDVATDSAVRWGSAPNALTSQQVLTGTRTEHQVRIAGLAAGSKYYYAVGSANATLAGNDANHFFSTAPAQGTAKNTRIWVLGDAGRGSAEQASVRNAYLGFTGTRGTDLVLLLGDNAYENGTDAEYQTGLFAMYPTVFRNTPVWSTRGNHERDAAAYYGIFTLPTQGEAGGVASGTEAYHSFNHGNIHFINLDSYASSRSASGAMANWLRSDLAANTLPWVIAFWHHPPYSKGSHDSDAETELVEMRQNILPILEAAGVDLVLAGHSHSYERSFLIDGHYGGSGSFTASMKKNGGSGRDPAPYGKPAGMVGRQGAVYAVTGSAASISGGTLDHPAMFISLNRLGSMVIDVDGNRLDARFVRETGAVDDQFTIVKGAAANRAPSVSLTAPSAGAIYTAPASISLAANASDSDGSVARVDFYRGATLIGSDSSAPYTFAWANVPAGSYTLSARAIDDKGASAASANVGITVNPAGNIAPSVVLTAPLAGSYTAPASIALAASASDSDGTVARVEFYAGSTLIATDAAAPYAGTWSNVAAGSHVISARAIDNLGAVRSSNTVTVTVGAPVNAAPRVSITSPANGSTYTAPASVTVQVAASDGDGSIARVELRRNGALVATDTAAPYGFALSNLPAGSHTLSARAVDDLGASRSASVVITVNAAAGTITSAAYGANGAYDRKNNISHGSASDPVTDLNRLVDQLYKLEVEHGAGYWWEFGFTDPRDTVGPPARVAITLHVVSEESWTGSFVAEYHSGGSVLARVALPLDSRKDEATGKGRKLVYTWNLSTQLRDLGRLAAGRVRVINSGGNGKKVWVTYTRQEASFAAP